VVFRWDSEFQSQKYFDVSVGHAHIMIFMNGLILLVHLLDPFNLTFLPISIKQRKIPINIHFWLQKLTCIINVVISSHYVLASIQFILHHSSILHYIFYGSIIKIMFVIIYDFFFSFSVWCLLNYKRNGSYSWKYGVNMAWLFRLVFPSPFTYVPFC
jgi:hypothetical protein